MRRPLRRLLTTLVVLGLLILPSAGLASSTSYTSANDSAPAPAMVDIFLMLPVGLLALVTGAALWVPAAAVTALTRPGELDIPTRHLLESPFRFVFVDAIGSH